MLNTERVQTPDTPYYVKALALGIPAILLGLQLSGWVFILPAIVNGHSDFRQLYTAGYMARAGQRHSLYDYQAQMAFQNSLVGPEQVALPFNHLAYEVLLFAPLSFLPYRIAFATFLAINLLLLGLSYRLLRPQLDRLAQIYRWLPAVMFVSFLPVGTALMQGQDSILLLTVIAGATSFLERKRDAAAGLLLGLGSFKFQIVVPIALLFFLCRRRRFAAGFVFSAALAGGVSLWLVGLKQVLHYSDSLLSMSVQSSALDLLKYGINPIFMANLRGLVYGSLGSVLPQSWTQVITLIASAALFLWAGLRLRARGWESDIMTVAVVVAVAVSYHLYIHDMSVLLVPILLAVDRFAEAESRGHLADQWALRGAAAMFAAPGLMSFLPFHFYLVCLPLLGFLYALDRSTRL